MQSVSAGVLVDSARFVCTAMTEIPQNVHHCLLRENESESICVPVLCPSVLYVFVGVVTCFYKHSSKTVTECAVLCEHPTQNGAQAVSLLLAVTSTCSQRKADRVISSLPLFLSSQ